MAPWIGAAADRASVPVAAASPVRPVYTNHSLRVAIEKPRRQHIESGGAKEALDGNSAAPRRTLLR
ncbi:MAG: hypothetical protein SangKO_074270 [Sandaracinaceae bacterium]